MTTALRERLRQWAASQTPLGRSHPARCPQAEGLVINHKGTEGIYREEGLSLRRKRRRKLPAVARVPLPAPQETNQRWSMDFIHDQLATGRRFRCLTLVDDFTRQCLAIHVDTSISGASVVAILQRLALTRQLPKTNGPEFTIKALHLWAQRSRVTLHHIQPGKPMQNAFIENFNGTFRDNCLNQHWISSLAEARLLIEHWRSHAYNQIRPLFPRPRPSKLLCLELP